ncbi:unnamed protein product, partial [Mesorhabditis spiculigera]
MKGNFLTLKCKNFMICVFRVADFEECSGVRDDRNSSNLNGFSLDYPFFYRAPFTVLDDGWNAFDVETEFSRISLCAPELYRISEVNKDFKVLATEGALNSHSQWRYFNCASPRIKDLHDSLAKMVDICLDRSVSSDRWMSKIGSAGWLSSVADYLNAAANVAQCVACEGSSEVPVVVHGGEGVDSTLFVTALAQILLDPDARTIRGFESVIEREWISGGHPFGLRNAHSAFAEGAITGPYESPVFLAFLDCVWQMCAQFPHSFEFTENFLLDLFEHSYASEFGSFLGNNEMEKFKHNVKKHTVSLWSYVNNPEILKGYVNTLYEPNESVLWPSVSPQSIQIWERLFLRWQRDWSEVNAIREAAAQWRLKERQLESKALSLRRQLIELTREAHLANGVAAVQLG